MVDVSKINEINDEVQLQKMLSSTEDFDQRKAIRNRLLEIKTQKSKERERQQQEREKKHEEEINERKRLKDEEKRNEMKRLEELAKSGSTSSRLENTISKQREDYLKEKTRLADDDKKKEIEKFEKMAKLHISANEKDDSAYQESIKQKAVWAAEDREKSIKNLESISKTKSSPSKAVSKPKNAAAAFEMFQDKDKEAGGGKAGSQSAVSNPNSIKENLLKWVQLKTKGYPNVSVQNFSSSFADGMAFCALIHQAFPDTFDFSRLNPKNRRGNFSLAFKVAEDKADIAPLLEVDDMLMMGDKPDWKCVFTYVQSFYRKFELEPKARAQASGGSF